MSEIRGLPSETEERVGRTEVICENVECKVQFCVKIGCFLRMRRVLDCA